jgi:hypothetical protein
LFGLRGAQPLRGWRAIDLFERNFGSNICVWRNIRRMTHNSLDGLVRGADIWRAGLELGAWRALYLKILIIK